jgi:hypothetical protein
MNPRAVQMAKAVAEYDAGSIDTELLGNILAPQYRGWTNNSANYYTRSPDPAGIWVHGSPFMGQPGVYGYQEDGTPLYRWFPIRPSNFQGFVGSAKPDYAKVRGIVPGFFSGTLGPAPIDNLDLYVFA